MSLKRAESNTVDPMMCDASKSTGLVSLRAEEHGALAGKHAAIAMGERYVAVGNLAVATFAADLTYRFDHREQTVHAGMAIRQATAVGVDCKASTRGDRAIGDEGAALAFGAEAQVLDEE